MKTQTQELRYYIATPEELTPADAALVEAAKAATYNSYSPYSHFSVGAAVRLENGEIVQGSNQENAAYSPTICAERCAMFYANAHHPDIAPTAIAIAARGTDGAFTPQPVSPCGVCRQVMSEFCKSDFLVYLVGEGDTLKTFTLEQMLPLRFTSEEFM